MIELQPFAESDASLEHLQHAMQADIKTFRRGETARMLLNNVGIAAKLGAAQATLAVQDEEAVGLVTVWPDRAHHTGNIRLLYVVPDTPGEAGAMLVGHAIETVWADEANRYLNATLFVDQPGIGAAFEENGAQRIERQEMRLGDLSAFGQTHDAPDGFRFVPFRTELVDAAAQLLVESYRGTLDETLFADMQTVEGMRQFVTNVMSGESGTFDAEGSVLVFQGETPAAMILCAISDGNLGFISDINVHPNFRRHGLARALLTNALGSFHRRGAAGAQLWVTLSNPARALYESLGFQAHAPMWVYVASRA